MCQNPGEGNEYLRNRKPSMFGVQKAMREGQEGAGGIGPRPARAYSPG